ncbi:hypothetical protein TNCV_1548291 [Trichonephila clavipes]|nr:hypothetical protein TNCV_1548291 [Trichonephila clavipes]
MIEHAVYRRVIQSIFEITPHSFVKGHNTEELVMISGDFIQRMEWTAFLLNSSMFGTCFINQGRMLLLRKQFLIDNLNPWQTGVQVLAVRGDHTPY